MGFEKHQRFYKMSTADLLAEASRLRGIVNDPNAKLFDKEIARDDIRRINRILDKRK